MLNLFQASKLIYHIYFKTYLQMLHIYHVKFYNIYFVTNSYIEYMTINDSFYLEKIGSCYHIINVFANTLHIQFKGHFRFIFK